MTNAKRKPAGLRVGMVVTMTDGWRGKIAEEGGGIVACLADGEKPDLHWCGDYRIVAPSSVQVNGSKAVVDWRSTVSSRDTDKRRAARSAVVADLLANARLHRQWQDAPDA